MRRMPARRVLAVVLRPAIVLAMASTVPMVAWAAPTKQAEAEIQALIGALEGSPCRFQRNGSWHDAAAAREHLLRKHDYLRRRDMADTAELFIARGASRSSMSGKPYRIQCPGAADVDAAVWFNRELQRIRQRDA